MKTALILFAGVAIGVVVGVFVEHQFCCVDQACDLYDHVADVVEDTLEANDVR